MKDILADCVRHDPWVWLRRVIIIENNNPETKPIRDIRLARGLNIIWAQEPDDEDAEAEISGHSAGKTSLCRLIRYVLGEKQFATKNNTRLLGKAFPEGYVGAELFVGGKQWAVIRPLKKGRNSYLKQNATVEEVMEDRSLPAFEHDYAEKLGLTALLGELPCATIIETGQPIKWDHLLAWCTRDQEMRFQDVFGWRSPRSESEWPAFEHPKGDPLFLMRVVLGLFLPEELKKEEALGEQKKQRDQLEKDILKLEKEPEFRVNLYDRELRKKLKVILPGKDGVDAYPLRSTDPLSLFPDLDRTTTEAASKLEETIAPIDDDRKKAQDLIDNTGAEIRELEKNLPVIESFINLETKAQTEINEDPAEREQLRRQLDEIANGMCIPGGILFSECRYVQTRREGLRGTEIQDAHASEQNEARRAESVAKWENQRQVFVKQIEGLKTTLEAAKRTRDGFIASLREKREELRDLKQTFDNLNFWTEKKSRPEEFKELNDTRIKLEKKTGEIAGTEQELDVLIQEHNANHQKLANIFSTAVQRVLLSGTYDGKVSLSERLLVFSITHGASMSGEAVETLAVLLADLSCLIYNAQNDRSNLPGFLLHDSPREADLGKRIYWNFLKFAASLQNCFSELDRCPFQYVLTTTTEPPKSLQTPTWIKLQLDASKTSQLLFARNISEIEEEGDSNLI